MPRLVDFEDNLASSFSSLDDLIEHARKYSPYFERLLKRHEDWIRENANKEFEDVLTELTREFDAVSFEQIGRELRLRKAKIALYLGLFAIAKTLPVLTQTYALTVFADFAIEAGLRYLISMQVSQNKLPEIAMDKDCGLFVLAMGKQGAFELNYSSDIDLIVLLDEDKYTEFEIFEIRKQFIRVVQRLIKLLSEQTVDGYVFRTDLRLRPDPSVTPVVITVDQAESYYEALGRTWERAAFIKARPCAGDIRAGMSFLSRLGPFIWRKHLDFAAIEDAHNMRLNIRTHKGISGEITFEGHHLKLGRGGIREIEFFTQTRQLIFGGRQSGLRAPSTLEALKLLAEAKIIDENTAHFLSESYLWLRELEHATQMIEDQQTHLIPSTETGINSFLGLLNMDSDFEAQFVKRIFEIDAVIDEFFESARDESDIDTHEFSEQEQEMIDAWAQFPATRSTRAQSIYNRLKSRILSALTQSAEPEQAVRNFDRFLRLQPAGVQLFSMFEANMSLLDLLTEICALAPREAVLLGSNPRIFEAVLSSEFFMPLSVDESYHQLLTKTLEGECDEAQDYEDILNSVRRFVREAQFRVSVHLLRGLTEARIAGACYSLIAELAVQKIMEAVNGEMARRYGPPPGRGAAILAMGKLGSREMTRSSDLDLVVIYDACGAEKNEGPKPLEVSNYFARLTQNLIQALTVATSEGMLFEVDMRLRPSGRQGPVAVSLASFSNYQLNEAWTWEHLALLRSRVVAGDHMLANDIKTAIQTALACPRDRDEQRKDVIEMLMKIRENFKPEGALSIKHGPGRMMELELLVQAFALMNNITESGQSIFDLLEKCEVFLNDADIATLNECYHFYYSLSHYAKLSFGEKLPENVPQGWIKLINYLSNCENFDLLSKKFTFMSESVLKIARNYSFHV